MTTATAETTLTLEERDATCRGHLFSFPGKRRVSINYHATQDGRHCIRLLGSDGRERGWIFDTIEEARARWSKQVAWFKSKGGTHTQTQVGGFGRWVKVG